MSEDEFKVNIESGQARVQRMLQELRELTDSRYFVVATEDEEGVLFDVIPEHGDCLFSGCLELLPFIIDAYRRGYVDATKRVAFRGA